MYTIEAFRNHLREIAAKTHGQTSNVRVFMGRQLLFMKDSSVMMMLPALEPIKVQDSDPDSATFGEFFHLVDFDAVDTGIVS